ncbi:MULTISPECIES: sodium-dependent transporter [unclassified Campylobacter]|uniref:sodium-dependent transporter n=1 Tax=unclassified Campylobacter TaxID=2593542 RepID=UPI001237D8AE|nr:MULTISPECIES: sodium-dependent transporter [unclassified Campylobacter]KAA6220584.1 sodium-dependent transporter [Campylobacter sp. LR185c]KAA6226288.1 sodium-dependent transporter [Campylobacter sp. LR286c]KAA6226780.1 sodium-dependent transporter [Campylobacter sp. LR196d]KAA6230217.1 sodium-dependent transporter [Campylobacter sp. LR291e]KAA8604248.1 sodium-dependent transporter [Campylobacter sp. LR185c]
MARQTWSNTLTYILTVAGATIGFGATWRFPYLVGENGGGAYVLVFCIAMIIIGIPVILVENVIGRSSLKNSVDSFKPKWQGIGYMGLLGSFGIMAYYMVLGGFVLVYIFSLLIGKFNLNSPINEAFTQEFYTQNIAFNPLGVGIFTSIFVLINYIILRKGIIDGIEKSVKFLMPGLFICLLIVIFRNLSLDGAFKGIEFYLKPDLSKIINFNASSISDMFNTKLFIDVLGQVFFALSLGFGVMITLSSHLKKNENMIKTAIYTGILNTLIAVLAGFMIFPVLFSANLTPDKGPSLVFETLPIAFSYVPFGSIVCAIFFTLLLIAALTTSLPIYQVIISVLEEKFKLSKKTAINLTLGLIFILGNLPCILCYGPWRDITIIKDKNIFDSFDFVSGNILFVLTAFLCCIYLGFVMGKEQSLKELSNNGKIKTIWLNIWFYYVKFILPFVIALIFYFGVFN